LLKNQLQRKNKVDYTFLTPVSDEVLHFAESLSSQHLGSKISLHTPYDFPETIEDTYFALQQLVKSLLKNNCIPIIIGGTQDLTYPMYRAYDG